MENEPTAEARARQRLAVVHHILTNNSAPAGELELIHQLEDVRIRMMPHSDTSCRYYADDSGWRVDRMDGGRSPPLRGELGQYPDWLAVILDVARVGGHIVEWQKPEWKQTLWFRVDHANQLVEFVDWVK